MRLYRLVLAAATAFALSNGAASAQNQPTHAAPRRIEAPQRFYPPLALREHQSGLVGLTCVVEAHGGLTCSVTSEEPAEWGFAEAALLVARDFRMAPRTVDGRSTVGGRVEFTITFTPQS